MALSSDQIQRLQAARGDLDGDGEEDPGATPDIPGYYAVLGEEFVYGRLALGVVENNTFPGILAQHSQTELPDPHLTAGEAKLAAGARPGFDRRRTA